MATKKQKGREFLQEAALRGLPAFQEIQEKITELGKEIQEVRHEMIDKIIETNSKNSIYKCDMGDTGYTCEHHHYGA